MWKDIKGYEGLYQISSEGTVRRFYKSKGGYYHYLKNRENGKYYTVCLSKDHTKKTFNVHRLVAEAYIERPEGATEVNHIDGNKHNNDVSNLEWVTARQNQLHSTEKLSHHPFGKPPKKIRCLDIETGDVVAEYHSLVDAAKSLGKISCRTGITLVCQGYQQTAYGYKWEYAD